MKLTKDQVSVIAELYAAEAIYLRSFGWIPLVPVIKGAPVFWRYTKTGEEFSQDNAVTEEKKRTYDYLKG